MIKRDLIGTNLIINQNKTNAFNLDTVLLADFIKLNKDVKAIIDYGTGNAGLLLYLSCLTDAKMIGLEVQPELCELAQQNIVENGLDKQITIINVDINDYVKPGFVDVVVANPPFFKVNVQKRLSENPLAKIARHEVLIDLKTLIAKMSKQLNNKGVFYMIHRPERLAEITLYLSENKLAIKRLRLVHSYLNAPANHLLIEAKKMSKDGMIVEKPLILYDKPHHLSEELKKIYEGEKYVTTKFRP